MLAVLTPGPAVATASAASAFTPMPCFSGSINATPPNDYFLQVTGHLDCASSDAATFGIAHYYGRAGDPSYISDAIFNSTLRRYATSAPTTFSVGNDFDSEDFGLCVVTDYEVRVACLRITRDKNTSLYAVTPLPTNDPLVNRPVKGILHDFTRTGPSCGGCW
ncbi:hypothetical protein WEI85_03395 [Actinomycetes bacterium KLBMP 9797]